ncbi:MAG: cell division protein FtsQ/DivIB [Pseudomonadota bacterium]
MLNRLLYALIISLAAGLGGLVWHSLDGPINKFVVRGDLTASEQARVNSVLEAGEFNGILSTPIADIESVLQQLPWARQVTVRRAWPDAVIVSLQRAEPIARWGEDRYLSAAGELVRLPDQYAGLPLFDIALESPAQTMGVYRLLDQILTRAELRISRLQQNRQGEWVVEVKRADHSDPVQLLLGAEQLNERAHRFLLLQRQVLQASSQAVAYVDARYASGLAVRYKAENIKDNDIVAVAGPTRTPSYAYPGGSN